MQNAPKFMPSVSLSMQITRLSMKKFDPNLLEIFEWISFLDPTMKSATEQDFKVGQLSTKESTHKI